MGAKKNSASKRKKSIYSLVKEPPAEADNPRANHFAHSSQGRKAMIRFLLAESDPNLLDALFNGVGTDTDGLAIDTANNLDQAMERLSDFDITYEVLIIGCGLHGEGSEICRRARALSSKLHILKVLDHYSQEAHRDALSNGASDVVSADRLPSGLEMRLQPIRQALELRRELNEQLGFAQRTAFAAMSSMGELGIVLEFLNKSFACGEPVSLANLLLEAVEKYDLKGIVRVGIKESIHVYSRAGIDQSAESKIMEHALTMGRIFEFRDRGAYNFGKVSLVVMGMPREDAERCGRLRDNLALLVEAADSKAIAMELDHIGNQRARAIQTAQKSLLLNLQMGRGQQKVANNQAVELVFQFKAALEDFLMHLVLTPNQETVLMHTVHNYTDKLVNLHKNSDNLIDNLEEVAELLADTDGAIG
jgi:hypothetical protein